MYTHGLYVGVREKHRRTNETEIVRACGEGIEHSIKKERKEERTHRKV